MYRSLQEYIPLFPFALWFLYLISYFSLNKTLPALLKYVANWPTRCGASNIGMRFRKLCLRFFGHIMVH